MLLIRHSKSFNVCLIASSFLRFDAIFLLSVLRRAQKANRINDRIHRIVYRVVGVIAEFGETRLKYRHHTCTATTPQEFEKYRVHGGGISPTIFESRWTCSLRFCPAWTLYHSRRSCCKPAALLPHRRFRSHFNLKLIGSEGLATDVLLHLTAALPVD